MSERRYVTMVISPTYQDEPSDSTAPIRTPSVAAPLRRRLHFFGHVHGDESWRASRHHLGRDPLSQELVGEHPNSAQLFWLRCLLNVNRQG